MRMVQFAGVAVAAMALATSADAAVIWSGTVGAGDPPTISATLGEGVGTYILTTDGTIVGTPVVSYNLTVENVLLQQDGQHIPLPTEQPADAAYYLAPIWIFPVTGGYEFHLYGFNGSGLYGGPPQGTDVGFSLVQKTFTTTFNIAVQFAPESVGASYELNSLGAVPEPATWALMITGFGMAGAALRRRRALPA